MSFWQFGGWLDGVDWLLLFNFGEWLFGDVLLIVVYNISLLFDEFGGDWVEKFFFNQFDVVVYLYFEMIFDVWVLVYFYVCCDGWIIQFVGCDQCVWYVGCL